MKTNRILSCFLVLAMTFILIPHFEINASATGAETRTVLQSQTTANTNQSSGIVYEKTAAAMSDGTVDITLSAHTTGDVIQSEADPADIVLVIDTSGSMDDPYTDSSVITGYEEAYATKYQGNKYGFSDADNSVNYYINTGTTSDPAYTQVTYLTRDNNGFQYFSYSNGTSTVNVYPLLASNVSTSQSRQYSYDVIQFYKAVTQTSSASRMTVLKEAVNSFIDATAAHNVGLETENMHSISIVKFAGGKYSNDTTDTPTLTEGNTTYVSGGYTYNYSQVVKNLTTVDGSGVTTLKNAINSLTPYGSTAVDKGLSLAELVLENRASTGTTDRNKVVIVFTDGEPNYFSGFDSTVANNAITTAYNMKSDADVSIFGVSVASNADATDMTANINKFMHYVSSNYPNATGMNTAGAGGSISNGYYMTPSSDTSLTNIFEKIGEEIDARSMELGQSAKMVDTLSACFDFASTNASDIKLQTSAKNQDGTWATPVTDTNLSYTIAGDKITVAGFDYNANYVSDEGRGDNQDFYGKKLIVSFTILPDYTFIDPAYATLVGGKVPTNEGDAIILDSNSEAVAQVASPELIMKNITYKVDGVTYKQYYRFPGSDKTVDAEPAKTGYTFSGWSYPASIIVSNNAFVMPNENVEITGTFIATAYNVTYQYSTTPPAGAPELPTSHTALYGNTVTVAEPAELQGYVFVGWYPSQTDVTVTDGQFTMPAKDVTLSGHFVKEHTVSYDFNGGIGADNVDYTTKKFPDGTEITVNAEPERTGYKFKGWREDTNKYASGDAVVVNKDIVFVAQWSRIGSGLTGIPTYVITYESNGGNKFDNETYTPGTIVGLDKVPVKEGYIFDGWRIDEALAEPTNEVKMTKNITVYAAWIKDNGTAGNGHPTPDILNGNDHFAYIIGYPDGTVKPEANITRAEVATIFFRLLNADVRDDNIADNNGFVDVNNADWHNKAISTMAKLTIFNGRSADKFAPDAYITRAEFATICARLDDSVYEIIDNFTDVDGHWAEEYVKEAAVRGWIKGYEDGTFKPDQLITRAEATTMINRVLNRVPETADDLLGDMIIWPDNNDKSVWYYLSIQEATNSHEHEMKNHIYAKWTAIKEGTDWMKYQ